MDEIENIYKHVWHALEQARYVTRAVSTTRWRYSAVQAKSKATDESDLDAPLGRSITNAGAWNRLSSSWGQCTAAVTLNYSNPSKRSWQQPHLQVTQQTRHFWLGKWVSSSTASGIMNYLTRLSIVRYICISVEAACVSLGLFSAFHIQFVHFICIYF